MSFKDYVVENVILFADRNQKLFESMKDQRCPKCEKNLIEEGGNHHIHMCKNCKTFGCSDCIGFSRLCDEHNILENAARIKWLYTQCYECTQYIVCNECCPR